VGASYVASADADLRDYGMPGRAAVVGSLHEQTNEATAYGEATRKLGGGLSVTLGARYASVSQSGNAVQDSSPFEILAPLLATPAATVVRSHVSGSDQRFLPAAALSYQLAKRTIVYVRHGQGFRPGGLTLGATDQRFTSDRLSTLEAGVRRGVAGVDRVALSLTGAVSQWRNIQADQLDGLGMPEILNIGNGRISSLDASAAARIAAGLNLTASGFLLGSRLDAPPSITEQGGANNLPNVVRNGAAVALDYQGLLAGECPWQAGLRVQHVGPSLLGVGPILDRPQGDYTTVGVGGGVRFGTADLMLNLSNLLNYRGDVFAVGTPLAALIEKDVTPLRPRTVRLGVRKNF
jgi:outer membrane receptor protein involved in Fe transport